MSVIDLPAAVERPAAAIELHQVVKTFKTAAGEFPVLKGINLTLREHEFVSIVGKSGSGKSTLLNMITGIDHPTTGEVCVGGTEIYRLNESQRALWRGRTVGIVFQFFQLLPMLTLLENTMLPMDYCQVYAPSERPARALELLALVGLQDQAHKLPAAVSTGQQQSAAIARALATDPPIIVADEPTGNLDSRSAEVIIQLFDQLAKQGKTIAMVTHDASLTERTQRNIIIADGELVDETVGRALPLLNHRHMLEVTRLIRRESFQPGATILTEGQAVDNFYMIDSGQVEIVLKTQRGGELVVARLGAGEFFGEVELVRGGDSLASVRAAPEGPVGLAMLPHREFLRLLADSPLTGEAIGKIVQARLAENQATDRRRR
jgi:ABC-type lipoprotein export system ATPase subunit